MSRGLLPLRTAVDEWTPGKGITSDPLHAIVTAWASIVGDDVAAHCAPLELAGKTLIVATKSSAWSQQLSFLGGTILSGIRARASGAGVERLSFRAGAFRPAIGGASRGTGGGRRLRRAAVTAAVLEPASDLQAAFERLRERMRGAENSGEARCSGCGVRGVGSDDGGRCAPCAGRAATERTVVLERIVYMAPWLTLAELRVQLPELSGSEFEHARRRLLQRWWLLLERARRSGRVSASGMERHVGSSYVLLQSRLPPDRISAAVVRNLLGDDLDALLWPRGRLAEAARVGPADALVE